MTDETGWMPMAEAPRDGREVELTWMDGGEPQEIHLMRWNRFASNPLFQKSKGIWAVHHRQTNEILSTWTEEELDGAPTHWRFPPPPTPKEKA